MPLNLPDRLPAIEMLKKENIFVIDNSRASSQDIRPLRIAILNLMPLKITTETDLIRLLSNTPLQIEISFMKVKGHTSKNTPIEHMKAFYRDFELMQDERFDGMIITGAPVEHLDLEGMGIGRPPHEAAQSVDFPDDDALRAASDMRIAGGVADHRDVHRQKKGLGPDRTGGPGRLDSGVSPADDDDIVIHQPIDPDMSSLRSWFSSTAYSIGSSREKGSMKPITIISVASFSLRPRLMR